MSTNAEEFSYETLRVAAQAAAAHEKTKLITVYPSQPYRSAVVTAVVTCDDGTAKEIAAAMSPLRTSFYSTASWIRPTDP
jgi:hypothetical protein